MVFTTETRPDLPIYVSRLGRTLRFTGGRYETTDRAEIAALRRNRFVTAEPEPTPPAKPAKPEPPEPEGGDDAGDKSPPQ